MGTVSAISKVLSANDVGLTGTHQAGILIPKRGAVLEFFPLLRGDQLNPRQEMHFTDNDGRLWKFVFVYYNNCRFAGTRDEYRLTCMTQFIRTNCLQPGDSILLSKNNGGYRVAFQKTPLGAPQTGLLKLGSRWRIVGI